MLPNMQLEKQCYDTIEALAYLREHQVDLIFLDLNIPKLKGFEFLKTLTFPPKVIVTTAYREYALEGYELNVVDYLLKPFSFERFLKAINKVISPIQTKQLQPNTQQPSKDYIFLRSNKKHIQVAINTILFLEAYGNYTKVFTKTDTITVREKISDLLETIASNTFIQVHRSFAVAKNHIERIEGNTIYIQNHLIPIGNNYKDMVMSFLKH